MKFIRVATIKPALFSEEFTARLLDYDRVYKIYLAEIAQGTGRYATASSTFISRYRQVLSAEIDRKLKTDKKKFEQEFLALKGNPELITEMYNLPGTQAFIWMYLHSVAKDQVSRVYSGGTGSTGSTELGGYLDQSDANDIAQEALKKFMSEYTQPNKDSGDVPLPRVLNSMLKYDHTKSKGSGSFFTWINQAFRGDVLTVINQFRAERRQAPISLDKKIEGAEGEGSALIGDNIKAPNDDLAKILEKPSDSLQAMLNTFVRQKIRFEKLLENGDTSVKDEIAYLTETVEPKLREMIKLNKEIEETKNRLDDAEKQGFDPSQIEQGRTALDAKRKKLDAHLTSLHELGEKNNAPKEYPIFENGRQVGTETLTPLEVEERRKIAENAALKNKNDKYLSALRDWRNNGRRGLRPTRNDPLGRRAPGPGDYDELPAGKEDAENEIMATEGGGELSSNPVGDPVAVTPGTRARPANQGKKNKVEVVQDSAAVYRMEQERERVFPHLMRSHKYSDAKRQLAEYYHDHFGATAPSYAHYGIDTPDQMEQAISRNYEGLSVQAMTSFCIARAMQAAEDDHGWRTINKVEGGKSVELFQDIYAKKMADEVSSDPILKAHSEEIFALAPTYFGKKKDGSPAIVEHSVLQDSYLRAGAIGAAKSEIAPDVAWGALTDEIVTAIATDVWKRFYERGHRHLRVIRSNDTAATPNAPLGRRQDPQVTLAILVDEVSKINKIKASGGKISRKMWMTTMHADDDRLKHEGHSPKLPTELPAESLPQGVEQGSTLMPSLKNLPQSPQDNEPIAMPDLRGQGSENMGDGSGEMVPVMANKPKPQLRELSAKVHNLTRLAADYESNGMFEKADKIDQILRSL